MSAVSFWDIKHLLLIDRHWRKIQQWLLFSQPTKNKVLYIQWAFQLELEKGYTEDPSGVYDRTILYGTFPSHLHTCRSPSQDFKERPKCCTILLSCFRISSTFFCREAKKYFTTWKTQYSSISTKIKMLTIAWKFTWFLWHQFEDLPHSINPLYTFKKVTWSPCKRKRIKLYSTNCLYSYDFHMNATSIGI